MNYKKLAKKYGKVTINSFVNQLGLQIKYENDGFEEAVLLGIAMIISELYLIRWELSNDD